MFKLRWIHTQEISSVCETEAFIEGWEGEREADMFLLNSAVSTNGFDSLPTPRFHRTARGCGIQFKRL